MPNMHWPFKYKIMLPDYFLITANADYHPDRYRIRDNLNDTKVN